MTTNHVFDHERHLVTLSSENVSNKQIDLTRAQVAQCEAVTVASISVPMTLQTIPKSTIATVNIGVTIVNVNTSQSVAFTIPLDEGNYTATTFAAHLQTRLTAVITADAAFTSWVFTCSQNSAGYLVITGDDTGGPFAWDGASSRIDITATEKFRHYFGLPKDQSTAQQSTGGEVANVVTWTSPRRMNMVRTNSISFLSDLGLPNFKTTSSAGTTVRTLVTILPAGHAQDSIVNIHFDEFQHVRHFNHIKHITTIYLDVIDEFGDSVIDEFQDHPFQINLVFFGHDNMRGSHLHYNMLHNAMRN